MRKNLFAFLLVLALCCTTFLANAEIIHCDPAHTDHQFNGNTCTVCGWMIPGFYMDDEMVLSWDELKSMGYVEVLEDGRLTKVAGNLDGKLVIDEEITKIDGNSFELFAGSSLKEVWIPRTVTKLGNYLTVKTSIREVRIYCPITELPENCFNAYADKHSALENVWLPDTIKSIGNSAFSECTGLKKLDLPDSVEELHGRFLYNTELKEMAIPPYLKDISSAFYACSLTNITLPATVEKISPQGFCYCDAEFIDMSKTQITVIPDQCFQYCKKLKTLILPSNLKAFGWACFADNRELKKLVLPDGFNDLGNNYFDYIEEIVWPVSLIDVVNHTPRDLKTIYYRGTENQWKLNGANVKWDLSNVKVICNYTGD